MKRLIICDRVTYAVTKREFTDEGFLKVPGRVARVGTQQYLARELDLTDRDPNDVITVYRPADEVFDAASLATYNGADVTNNHPTDLVNPETYRDVAVGTVVSAGRRDGDFVVADMIVKAKDSIEAVDSGKVQLSAGYTAIYDETPGVTPDGVAYDFIQRDIRINHVALVDRARAGFQARLFDNKPKGLIMPRITLDGTSVEVADEATAALITTNNDRLMKRVADAESDAAEAKKKADKAQAEKDAAEEETKKAKMKSSDEAIAARIAEVSTVKDAAVVIAGPDFTCDSVDLMTIKRAALAVSKDSIDWTKKDDNFVNVAFDMAEPAEVADASTVEEQRRKLAADSSTVTNPESDGKPSARQAYHDSLSGAWKNSLAQGAS